MRRVPFSREIYTAAHAARAGIDVRSLDEVPELPAIGVSPGFHEIAEVVAEALDAVPAKPIPTLASALEADSAGRTAAAEAIESRSVR